MTRSHLNERSTLSCSSDVVIDAYLILNGGSIKLEFSNMYSLVRMSVMDHTGLVIDNTTVKKHYNK